MSNVTTAHMTMVRSTKGAVLYKNTNAADGQSVTTIYLRKDGLVEPYPGEIVVTVVRKDDEEG